jgi:glyoxylase-like metal-dependent hydrolase (beta-lactamase superfamily II)
VIHEIYALHIGDKQSTRSEFLFRDSSRDPLTISFYLWLVLGGPEPILYDVAFDADQARTRSVRDYADRTVLLSHLGVAPGDIKTIVMSHLHWDHWAGYALFDQATFLLQADELAFWRGPAARHQLVMSSANAEALDAATGLEAAGRIRLLDGTRSPLWPGLEIVPLPGHTPGLQALLIETARGPVMLASDALHYYENYRLRRPVQVTMNMPQALDAYDVIERLVGDDVVGGHDPMDQSRFPTFAPGVFRIA